jgi:hypothetical protein
MFALLPRAVLYSGCISCSITFLLSAFVSLIEWVPCRSMNAGGSQHTGYGGQPYMQQPTAQYVDIDGAYAHASNSGFPPPSPPHRPDYRQQQR